MHNKPHSLFLEKDYNVELATSATAIQVNGNAVDNSAGDQFSVSGTTLTATGASLTAGHTVTVVMGARTKFLLTGQDVGATDSITVDDVTTGFTLTGSATSKLVTMAAAPASNISIKILNASTTTFCIYWCISRNINRPYCCRRYYYW